MLLLSRGVAILSCMLAWVICPTLSLPALSPAQPARGYAPRHAGWCQRWRSSSCLRCAVIKSLIACLASALVCQVTSICVVDMLELLPKLEAQVIAQAAYGGFGARRWQLALQTRGTVSTSQTASSGYKMQMRGPMMQSSSTPPTLLVQPRFCSKRLAYTPVNPIPVLL